MSDYIERDKIMNFCNAVINRQGNEEEMNVVVESFKAFAEYVKALPSAQPEINCSEFPNNSDTISRQAAIDALDCINGAEEVLRSLPPAQPEERTAERTETHACDCISRKDAIRWIKTECNPYGKPTLDFESGKRVMKHLEQMPPAQPERTCVNCGRTANNGGWYADGRTRCPIEEHYALPKDGYCHLWEKRNVADDDYPERRTDE